MAKGRRTWQPPAACLPEIADAVGRLVELWRVQIECRRFKRPAGDATVRCDLTAKRGYRVYWYLLGLNGRPQFTERQLADAITAYSRSTWHQAERRWRLLTGSDKCPGFLDDADFVELWVNKATSRAAEAAASPAGQAAARARASQADAAMLERARQRLAAMVAGEPTALAELERELLDRMPSVTRELVGRQHRKAGGAEGRHPGVDTSFSLRLFVLEELKRRIRDEGQPAANG